MPLFITTPEVLELADVTSVLPMVALRTAFEIVPPFGTYHETMEADLPAGTVRAEVTGSPSVLVGDDDECLLPTK